MAGLLDALLNSHFEFNRPLVRPAISEAGALGAAIIAGVGAGTFSSYEDGVKAMFRLQKTFEPDPRKSGAYDARFAQYKQLWPLLKDYLPTLTLAESRAGRGLITEA